MTLNEFRNVLLEHAKAQIPSSLQNLVTITTRGELNQIWLENTKSDLSDKILREMHQDSVSTLISRGETLSGFKQVRAYSKILVNPTAPLESVFSESFDSLLLSEKEAITNNIYRGLTLGVTQVASFIDYAKTFGIIQPDQRGVTYNPLHNDVLNFFLRYREQHPGFVFWLRERNRNNRLNEGYWFQGNDNYAFVGLYDSWSGNLSTKGIGLVFYYNDKDIGVTFELIYRDEGRREFLAFYADMRKILSKRFGSQFKGENNNHYWIELSKDDAFDVAEKFLDEFSGVFNKLIEDHMVNKIIIPEKDFNTKLGKTLEIRQRILAGDLSLVATKNAPASETSYSEAPASADEEGIEEDASESHLHRSNRDNSNVKLQLDTPAKEDELGRKSFVDALFNYIKNLWDDQEQRDDSYTIHLNGEWGSGKSTVLRLLKEKLEDKSQEESKRWIVVDFNAWRKQHIDVPWWAFVDTVYKRILEETPWWKKPWVILREFWWRTVSMNYGKWATFVIMVGILCFTLITGSSFLEIDRWIDTGNANNTTLQADDKFTVVLSFLSLIGSAWLFIYGIVNSLLPGSEESAKQYKQHVRDPMEKIKDHYRAITNYSPRSIAVFIDDIDRCEPKFVVQLLEGLQTLFRTEKLLYVIAGDAMWIRQSFDIHYRDLRKTITQKGQSLGNFFVEKTLQQSVSLPVITEEIKRAYWKRLLQGKENKSAVNPQDFAVNVSKVASATNQNAMSQVIRSTDNEEERTLLREKAALRVSSQEILTEIKHELLQYHEYLTPNPRSMKRLINNLALTKASNFLSGIDEKVGQDVIVRWAILKSSFPTIASEIKLNHERLAVYKDKEKHPKISVILENIHEETLEYLND